MEPGVGKDHLSGTVSDGNGKSQLSRCRHRYRYLGNYHGVFTAGILPRGALKITARATEVSPNPAQSQTLRQMRKQISAAVPRPTKKKHLPGKQKQGEDTVYYNPPHLHCNVDGQQPPLSARFVPLCKHGVRNSTATLAIRPSSRSYRRRFVRPPFSFASVS